MEEDDNPFANLAIGGGKPAVAPPAPPPKPVGGQPQVIPYPDPNAGEDVNPFANLTNPPTARIPATVNASKSGQPFGELKSYTPSWSEAFKNKIQDALLWAGAKPGAAQHLSEGLTGVTQMTPAGPVLSGLDLTYHLPRGEYGKSALDVLGMWPALSTTNRALRGARPNPGMIETPAETTLRQQANYPVLRTAETPTTDELLGSARTGYSAIRHAPIEYHPDSGIDFQSRVIPYIESPAIGGFSPEKAPHVHTTIDRFANNWSQRGRPITPDDWDTLRQQLRGLPDANGPAGERAIQALDQYMARPPSGALLTGSPSTLDTVRRYFDLARGEYRAGKTSQMVENAIDRAGTKSGSRYSGLNTDNLTRQQIESLHIPDLEGQRRLWAARPDEIANLEGVSAGDPTTNRLRYYGNQLGGGGGIAKTIVAGGLGSSAATAAALHFGVDPITAGALGTTAAAVPYLAGSAMRRAANERTVNQATEAAAAIRRNSPTYAAREAVSPPVVDPRAQLAEAVAYALTPGIKQAGMDAWNRFNTPYENR